MLEEEAWERDPERDEGRCTESFLSSSNARAEEVTSCALAGLHAEEVVEEAVDAGGASAEVEERVIGVEEVVVVVVGAVVVGVADGVAVGVEEDEVMWAGLG